MRKGEALKRRLPEPELLGSENPETLIVSWGSNKGVILDVLKAIEANEANEANEARIGYLHYTYLWPLKTERFKRLAASAKRLVLVECNKQGQLGMLLKQESGIDITHKILKYDGRPFFYDELLSKLKKVLP